MNDVFKYLFGPGGRSLTRDVSEGYLGARAGKRMAQNDQKLAFQESEKRRREAEQEQRESLLAALKMEDLQANIGATNALAEYRRKGLNKPATFKHRGREFEDTPVGRADALKWDEDLQKLGAKYPSAPQRPQSENGDKGMTPVQQLDFTTKAVDNLIEAAGGDPAKAYQIATRLDSPHRAQVRSRSNPSGFITEDAFRAGADRYRQKIEPKARSGDGANALLAKMLEAEGVQRSTSPAPQAGPRTGRPLQPATLSADSTQKLEARRAQMRAKILSDTRLSPARRQELLDSLEGR